MDLMDYRWKIIANSPHLMSASGAVASFSDGADLPLKSLNVDIEPVQSGTGDPSPTNVRAISGWDAVKVTRCGKNLFDKSVFADYSNWLHPINTSGFGTDDRNKGCFLPKLKANTSYTISFDWDTTFPTYLYLCKVNADGVGTRVAYLTTTNINNKKVTFTLAEGERAYLRMGRTDNATAFNANFSEFGNCMLEEGSTATPYEPYNGVTVTVQLGETVYGGTLNPLTGVLTAYPYYASYNGETLTGRWVSDRDKYVAGTTPTNGAQVVDMSGTGTEIQLTPQQIRSLYGNNTIFADTGNVALEYWAHP